MSEFVPVFTVLIVDLYIGIIDIHFSADHTLSNQTCKNAFYTRQIIT